MGNQVGFTPEDVRACSMHARGYGPTHGMRGHIYDTTGGEVDHKRDAVIPTHDITDIHIMYGNTHGPTQRLCTHPYCPRGITLTCQVLGLYLSYHETKWAYDCRGFVK